MKLSFARKQFNRESEPETGSVHSRSHERQSRKNYATWTSNANERYLVIGSTRSNATVLYVFNIEQGTLPSAIQIIRNEYSRTRRTLSKNSDPRLGFSIGGRFLQPIGFHRPFIMKVRQKWVRWIIRCTWSRHGLPQVANGKMYDFWNRARRICIEPIGRFASRFIDASRCIVAEFDEKYVRSIFFSSMNENHREFTINIYHGDREPRLGVLPLVSRLISYRCCTILCNYTMIITRRVFRWLPRNRSKN